MVDTVPAAEPQASTIYDKIGVRTIINASGATTRVSGTLMPPEVVEAMIDASKAFVVLSELNEAVGKKVAEATGAEAGYVTAGSAAGMLLSVAACITGTDPAKIKKLPDTDGMANEVIVHRMHRIGYDQMFRAAGGTFVEIGMARGTEPWELEDAISDRTACVAYIDSPSTGTGALDFDTVVEIAHRHNIPVVVDAASTLPPRSHLTRWIERGADLVIYSGGKGIRGPQDSGMVAGRADLIRAAAANGNPNGAIGRAAKVSKEAMAGLYVALERFLSYDHDRDYQEHIKQAEIMYNAFKDRSGVRCELMTDQEAYPAPLLTLFPDGNARWNAKQLNEALQTGEPAIFCKVEHGGLQINTHCLLPGEPEQIVESVSSALDRWSS